MTHEFERSAPMSVTKFRWIALLEATSFLALLAASVVKRTGGGEMGVTILGPLHGAQQTTMTRSELFATSSDQLLLVISTKFAMARS